MGKKNKASLLIIEDDEGIQTQLKWCFDELDVAIAANFEQAIAGIRRFSPSVVTLDLGLPPDPANVSEGFKTLQEILKLAPNTKVIVITGNEDRENAVKAIAMGAFDFYQKPIDTEILKIIVERATNVSKLESENRKLLKLTNQSPLDGLITEDAGMLKVCRMIEKIAPTDTTNMLSGESGTGKEILARSIHQLSERAENRFVAINCAAIPDNLLESELFGHEKGAFTGATKTTPGKLELADGGTLFLDEVGDLPLPLQAKLLRFLQERVVERVGGRDEIPIDTRVISATHRDIKAMIVDKTFREDLYYRLGEITVEIPPLRERAGDVVLLAKVFLDKYSGQTNNKIKGFTPCGIKALEEYSWPGNVRELENTIKRAMIMAETNMLSAEDVGLESTGEASIPLNLREVREQAEKETIRHALTYTSENISKTAEMLGVSRPTLYDLMNKYDLK